MSTKEERLPILGGSGQQRHSKEDNNNINTTTDTKAVVASRTPNDAAITRSLNDAAITTTTEDKESEGEDEGEGSGRAKGSCFFLSLSSTKRWTLALLAFANTAASLSFSLLAPFYPAEAIAKDMSETLIGMVFSIYALLVFAASPIFGNYMTHIGPRFAFIAGLFFEGGCSILFGTLNLVPSGATFIVLSIVLRCMMALGAAGFTTASFTLIANEFPDHISVVFATLEVFTGLGYSLGPLLGGLVFDLGGFGLPFYSTGVFLILWSFITYFLMPARADHAPKAKRQGSVLRLLASPLVAVSCITLVSGTYTLGFLDSSLALHLQQFNLSAAVTGVFFMIVATLYSMSSPVYGWLSDNKNLSYTLLVLGSLAVGLSLLLVGPSPLLPFLKPDLGLVIFSLMVMGIGEGAIVIPVVRGFYIGARRLGFQDGLELDGLISGLLTSSIYFGSFLGPTIGSSVMQATSYEWSATVNAGLHFLCFALLLIYKGVEKVFLKHETTHTLLPPYSDPFAATETQSYQVQPPPQHSATFEEEEF